MRHAWIQRLSLIGLVGSLGFAGLATAPSASALSTAQPCLTAFDDLVSVAITLAPGETIEFDHTGVCSGGYFLGIRAYGSQRGSTPVTAGVVQSSLDGITWTTVTGTGMDNNASFRVRYTAPSTPGSSDSFYLISAAFGGGYAGYLYSVSVPGDVPDATAGSPRDLTVWQQAVARASAQSPCPPGYGDSWAMWPNDGAGGWVCVRSVWAHDDADRDPPQ